MVRSSSTWRETAAFSLAIIGASLWTGFPITAVLHGEGIERELMRMVVLAAGGLVGAYTAATVWKHVRPTVPAIVAAAFAAFLTLSIFIHPSRRVDPGWLDLLGVPAAVAGTVAGTRLGWRAIVPRRVLTAAWITISAPALLGVSFLMLSALGVSIGRGLAWLTFLAFVPGAYAAGRLCGGVDPSRFFATLLGLMFVAFGVVALAGVDDIGRAAAIGGLVLWSILPSALAVIPMVRAHRASPAPEEMPPAKLVER